MADRLHLEIVTPSRRVVEVAVDEVRLPGALGEMGVLPGHIPLLTSLAAGPLTYFDGSTVVRYAVQGGFAEVLPDRVTVLATVAEAPADIDVAAAKNNLQDRPGEAQGCRRRGARRTHDRGASRRDRNRGRRRRDGSLAPVDREKRQRRPSGRRLLSLRKDSFNTGLLGRRTSQRRPISAVIQW